MADAAQNFRTAFHGFNREDVVAYLQTLISQHTIELNQLQDENKRLLDELSTLRTQKDEADEQLRLAGEEKDTLKKNLEELTRDLEAATEPAPSVELEALQEENRTLREKLQGLETVPAEAGESSDWNAQELAAYRRAENVERQARNRAGALCDRVNGLMGDLTVRLDENRGAMDTAAEAMGKALDLLQSALDSSRATVQEGAATLSTLRVENPGD